MCADLDTLDRVNNEIPCPTCGLPWGKPHTPIVDHLLDAVAMLAEYRLIPLSVTVSDAPRRITLTLDGASIDGLIAAGQIDIVDGRMNYGGIEVTHG